MARTARRKDGSVAVFGEHGGIINNLPSPVKPPSPKPEVLPACSDEPTTTPCTGPRNQVLDSDIVVPHNVSRTCTVTLLMCTRLRTFLLRWETQSWKDNSYIPEVSENEQPVPSRSPACFGESCLPSNFQPVDDEEAYAAIASTQRKIFLPLLRERYNLH